MKLTKKTGLLASVVVLLCATIAGFKFYSKTVNTEYTIWGEKIDYAEFMPVINSEVMQRLKHVDQSGAPRYLGPAVPAFSRYDHSIGVYAILKRAGASKKELVAGLLHDVSHTVFSHVGDYIWAKDINEYNQSSFQDKIHLSYLQQNKVEKTLKLVGLTLKDIDIQGNNYKRLEQNLPEMCADRIQYNIHTGVIMGKINKSEAKQMVENLRFEDEKWFFTDPKIAAKFASLSLDFTQNFWSPKWNTIMNVHFADALKRALKLKIIASKDLFTTDQIVMNKLIKNQDHLIQLNLQQCKQPTEKIAGQKYKKEIFYPKFRGIDPLIKTADGEFKRLTEIDPEYKKKYEDVKKWCKEGYEVDILDA